MENELRQRVKLDDYHPSILSRIVTCIMGMSAEYRGMAYKELEGIEHVSAIEKYNVSEDIRVAETAEEIKEALAKAYRISERNYNNERKVDWNNVKVSPIDPLFNWNGKARRMLCWDDDRNLVMCMYVVGYDAIANKWVARTGDDSSYSHYDHAGELPSGVL